MLENVPDQTRKLIYAGAAGLVLIGAFLLTPSGDESPSSEDQSSQTTSDTPEQTAIVEDAEKPAFDLVRISRGGTGVIAGRMAPGAKVELYANGEKISEVIADDNGEWVIILDEPLEAGSVELNLKAKADETAEEQEAADVVVVSVPERDNQRFMETRENGVVAVLSPKDGEGASRVLQKPGVAAFSEVGESLAVETIDYGAGGNAVVAGRSLPRVDVRLYLDDKFMGAVRAGDEGKWQIAINETISDGMHKLRVDQTVSEGQVQLRIEQPFETGAPIDPSKAEGGVMIRPGNTLWQIARQLYGSGVRYTLIFRENSEQILDPDLIYPGQIFRLPTAAEKADQSDN